MPILLVHLGEGLILHKGSIVFMRFLCNHWFNWVW
jgi:hypothetical protein